MLPRTGSPPAPLVLPIKHLGTFVYPRTPFPFLDFPPSLTEEGAPADPLDIPTIEIGFLDGNEEPELFIQDQPTVGAMFSHDKLTWKLRHTYGGNVLDFRGLTKAVVA